MNSGDNMKKNNILIIVAIILIIALVIGAVILIDSPTKKHSRISITSSSTLNEGDNISVKLTDMNGRPIKNETVNITIFGKDGSINYNSIITNKDGIGILKLEKSAGKYTNNATFSGNEDYLGNSTSQKFIIKENDSGNLISG